MNRVIEVSGSILEVNFSVSLRSNMTKYRPKPDSTLIPPPNPVTGSLPLQKQVGGSVADIKSHLICSGPHSSAILVFVITAPYSADRHKTIVQFINFCDTPPTQTVCLIGVAN